LTTQGPGAGAARGRGIVRRLAGGRHLAVVAVLGGLALFAYRGLLSYDPAGETRRDLEGADGLFFSPTDSNPTLIFALTALLLYQRRHRILEASARAPSAWLALPLVLSASALCVWAHYVGVPELLVPSLSLMLLGAGAWWGGRTGLRALLVPALFLLLAYRPPGILISHIIYPLQILTVEVTHGVLDLLAMESHRIGDMILTREKAFHVIESCAGLRSIETLLMASVIYVEIMGCPRRRAGILVAASPLVGMLVNQIRVLTLVFNPYSGFASIHTLQGIVMIVAGVLMIASLDWLLARLLPPESRPRPPPAADPSSSHTSVTLVPRLVGLGLLLGCLGVATWAIPVWQPARLVAPRLARFPVSLPGWALEGLPLDKEFLGSVGFSEWVHRRYTKEGREVTLFLASNNRLEPRMSLISPKTTLPGAGWELREREPLELPPEGLAAEVLVLQSRAGQSLAYYWYEGVETFSREALRSVLVLDRGPLRRQERALVVRLSTPLGWGGREAAEKTLDEFLALAQPALANLRRPAS